MPILKARIGQWNIPHLHQWKERKSQMKRVNNPMISAQTRIATIGSCFAEELAAGLDRLELKGGMHPGGLFYNSTSIRQEVERIFGGFEKRTQTDLWNTSKGLVDPFRKYGTYYKTEKELLESRELLDHKADELVKSAQIIVITLGLIEVWKDPQSDNVFNQIPHPEIFEAMKPEFFRLSVANIKNDLIKIRQLFREHMDVELVVTVSPVPLHSTFTEKDIRVANMESKSRLRAAVSEFIDEFPDVHYFHSYDMVSAAEVNSDFMMEDGRHVHRHAVDYILSEFLHCFAQKDIKKPSIDSSWITEASKNKASVKSKSLPKELMKHLPQQVKDLIPSELKNMIRKQLF